MRTHERGQVDRAEIVCVDHHEIARAFEPLQQLAHGAARAQQLRLGETFPADGALGIASGDPLAHLVGVRVQVDRDVDDATVHFGCGLHAGPAPTGPNPRRTLYLQHYSPRAAELIGPYQGYNQIMPGYGAGDIPNIDEMREKVEA